MKYAHYALTATLIAAIIATGAYAVSLTHVHASITVAFGDQTNAAEIELADALPVAVTQHPDVPSPPHPQHKPKVAAK